MSRLSEPQIDYLFGFKPVYRDATRRALVNHGYVNPRYSRFTSGHYTDLVRARLPEYAESVRLLAAEHTRFNPTEIISTESDLLELILVYQFSSDGNIDSLLFKFNHLTKSFEMTDTCLRKLKYERKLILDPELGWHQAVDRAENSIWYGPSRQIYLSLKGNL